MKVLGGSTRSVFMTLLSLSLGVPGCGSSRNDGAAGSCVPQCGAFECGRDGCGGVCGTCSDDKFCNANHTCVASTDPSVVCQDLSSKRKARPTGDLYVAKTGDDSNDGRTYETAFATIQKGMDALQAGETLIVGAGEYLENVARGEFVDWEYKNGLGSPDVDTLIRAEIPGTVVIRGDAPAPSFQKLDGARFVYVADYKSATDVVAVNEIDSLQVLAKKDSVALLDYLPGGFVYDREAEKIYISTTDYRPASEHRYSFSLSENHGLALVDATRVIVDGIAVTGFNMGKPIFGWSDYTAYTVWGIFLTHSRDCVISNSYAYFNARGIGVTSGSDNTPSGGNVIDASVAWANNCPVATEDTGGITLDSPIGDTVSNSIAYMNGGLGINIFNGDSETASRLTHNLAWGNEIADYKIKAGEHPHSTEYSVGLGDFSHSTTPSHCLVGGGVQGAGDDSIVLQDEESLDPNVEFVDPDNFDFRLQANSRFRGAASNGEDRGSHAYEGDVFFVSPTGDDSNDGTSVGHAWRTLAHAAERLSAGQTLLIEPATYDEEVTWTLEGTEADPISIRGRGTEPVVASGRWSFFQSRHVDLTRVAFSETLRVEESEAFSVRNAHFLAADRGLIAANTAGLRITHSTFTGFADAAMDLPCSVDSHLAGNLYNNHASPAILMRDGSAVSYANYNSYAQDGDTWLVGTELQSFDVVQSQHEPQSQRLTPSFISNGLTPELENGVDFASGGPHMRPFGTYRESLVERSLRLVSPPEVHSVSATTVNLEWVASLPAVASITWGDSAAMQNTMDYSAQSFATLSLSELAPGTTYHFRINALAVPDELELDIDPLTLQEKTLTFTTLAADAQPTTYYVSTTGDDGNDGLSLGAPWRSIQHAANQVGVGDTVEIAGGRYYEQVYVRATGAFGGPITFTNRPGERVYLDGNMGSFSNAFVVAGKAHLVFDGLYFQDHGNNNPWSGSFTAAEGADINLYRSRNIAISRCLAVATDFQLQSVIARFVEDLTIENSVFYNHFQTFYLHDTPNTVVRNSVVARPWVFGMILYNDPETPSIFEQTIFTDNFKSKADQNGQLFYSGADNFVQTDCAYVLRDEHAPAWRELLTGVTAFDAPQTFVNPLFADPQFAAVQAAIAGGASVEFPPDAFADENLEYDFDSFFATNPEVTGRGIGLDPQGFDATGAPN